MINKLIHFIVVVFFFCSIFSCTNKVELKSAVFKDDSEKTLLTIAETLSFSTITLSESAQQSGDDEPEYELELTLENGQNIPENEEGLDSLGNIAATMLKKSVLNIHDYDWIFIVFDDPVLINRKKKTFGYRINKIKKST